MDEYEKLEEELKKVYEVIMLLLIVGKFVTLKEPLLFVPN